MFYLGSIEHIRDEQDIDDGTEENTSRGAPDRGGGQVLELNWTDQSFVTGDEPNGTAEGEGLEQEDPKAAPSEGSNNLLNKKPRSELAMLKQHDAVGESQGEGDKVD